MKFMTFMTFMTWLGIGLVLTGVTLYGVSVISRIPEEKSRKVEDAKNESLQKQKEKEQFVLDKFICENIVSFDKDVFTINKISTYSGNADRYEFLVGDSVTGLSRDFCYVRDAQVFFRDTIPCVKLYMWKNKDRLFSQKTVVEIYLPPGAIIQEVGSVSGLPTGRGVIIP